MRNFQMPSPDLSLKKNLWLKALSQRARARFSPSPLGRGGKGVRVGREGFTLIELVMAIVIGAIIFLPLLNIFGNVPVKNTGLEAYNMAVHLATGKMEMVSNKIFGSINSEAPASFGGDFSDFSRQVIVNCVASDEPDVSVDPTITGYKRIKVVVTSSSFSGGSVEVTTLAVDGVN